MSLLNTGNIINQRFQRLRGDSSDISIPLYDPKDGSSFDPTGCILLFSIKINPEDDDTAALVQKISLIGGITVANPSIVSLVPADYTTLLTGRDLAIDIQAQNAVTGKITTCAIGVINFQNDVTKLATLSIPTTTTNPTAGFTYAGLPDRPAILDSFTGLVTTGILVRTGTGVVATRTILAGAGVIVAQGDGVAGNITISIDSSADSITIGTTTIAPGGTSLFLAGLTTLGMTGVLTNTNNSASTSTGTGAIVVTGGAGFGGRVSALNFNGLTVTVSTGTLTIANGKVLTLSNTLTFTGTDSTTLTFPTTSATIARTDAAQTFTGTQTINSILSAAATNLTFGTAAFGTALTFTSATGAATFVGSVTGASPFQIRGASNPFLQFWETGTINAAGAEIDAPKLGTNGQGLTFYVKADGGAQQAAWSLSAAGSGTLLNNLTVSGVGVSTYAGSVTVSGSILGSGGSAPTSITTGSNIFTAGVATSGPIFGGALTATTGTFSNSVISSGTEVRVVSSSGAFTLWKDATPSKAARMIFNSASADGVSLDLYNGSSWQSILSLATTGNGALTGNFTANGTGTHSFAGAVSITGVSGAGNAINATLSSANGVHYTANNTNTASETSFILTEDGVSSKYSYHTRYGSTHASKASINEFGIVGGGRWSFSQGTVTIADTSTSSSTSTGALIVGNGSSGGLGVGGTVNIGGTLRFDGQLFVGAGGGLQIRDSGGTGNVVDISGSRNFTTAGILTVSGTGTNSFAGNLTVSGAGASSISGTQVSFPITGISNAVLISRDSTSTTYGAISFNGDLTPAGKLGFTAGGGTDKTLYLNVPTGGTYIFNVNNSTQLQVTSTGTTFAAAVVGAGGSAPTSTTTGSNQFTAGIATSGPAYVSGTLFLGSSSDASLSRYQAGGLRIADTAGNIPALDFTDTTGEGGAIYVQSGDFHISGARAAKSTVIHSAGIIAATFSSTQSMTLVGNITVSGSSILADGTRPVTLLGNSGLIQVKGSSGGWNIGLEFIGSAGTAGGGIWGSGATDALTSIVIGGGPFATPWTSFSSTGITSAGTGTSAFAGVITASQALSGSNFAGLTVTNSSNTASSAASIKIVNGGTSGGIPYLELQDTGVRSWYLGVDGGASGNDRMVLGTSATSGGGHAIRIASNLNVTFPQAAQIVTFSSTVSGTSTAAAAVLAKSLGLTENLYVAGTVTLPRSVYTTSASGAVAFSVGNYGFNRLQFNGGTSGFTFNDSANSINLLTITDTGVAAFLNATEATTGGAGSVTTAGGFYAGKKVISGSTFTSADPLNGAGAWMFGQIRSGVALAISTVGGLQVKVDGTIYTLAILLTNP